MENQIFSQKTAFLPIFNFIKMPTGQNKAVRFFKLIVENIWNFAHIKFLMKIPLGFWDIDIW
jgi:hypothetical protein